LLLIQVVLTYVVYEKQHKLKIMMKMHGLKDRPYWIISYAYFFALSSLYMLCFVIFGSVIRKTHYQFHQFLAISCQALSYLRFSFSSGLKFFTLNAYSIQLVFYFIYINLQIALAFLVSAFFSNTKTATGMILFEWFKLQEKTYLTWYSMLDEYNFMMSNLILQWLRTYIYLDRAC